MRTFLLLICLLLFSGGGSRANGEKIAEHPILLLENALAADTATAQPEKLMALYRRVLDHPKAGPRTRAQAHFFLAELHESLGHLLSARRHFLALETHLPLIPELKQRCLFSLQDIAILIAEEDCESIAAHEYHFLCDLFLGLDGALRQKEKERGLELTDRLQTVLLEANRKEEPADSRLLTEVHKTVTRINRDLANDAFDSALNHLSAGEIQVFVNPPAYADDDELFSHVFIQLATLTRALNNNQAQQATTVANSILTYLRPLLELSAVHQEERECVVRLTTLAETVIARVDAGEPGVARRAIDAFCLQQYQAGGHPHFHLGHDLTETLLDTSLYPEFALITDHLASASESAEKSNREATLKALGEALTASRKILQQRSESPDKETYQDFTDSIEAMMGAVREEGPGALTQFLEWEDVDDETFRRGP